MHRFICLAAIAALAVVLAPATAGAQGTKKFEFTLSPTEVGQHSEETLTATIKNRSSVLTDHKIGSANIKLSEFVIEEVEQPPTCDGPLTCGTVTGNGDTVELRGLHLRPGRSVSVKFHVTTPAEAGKYPVAAAVKSSQTFQASEKESNWTPVSSSPEVDVDSTNETKKDCKDVEPEEECKVTQRHTVPSTWLQVGASAGTGGIATASTEVLYVDTTVIAPGGSDGELVLRFLNPDNPDDAQPNTDSACDGGLDGDPHVEPSDAAALFNFVPHDSLLPAAPPKKTVQYEISADLWERVLANNGELNACFSAPFAFLADPFDPPFKGPDGFPWINGLLEDCDEDQETGVCVERDLSGQVANGEQRITIEIQPPFVGGSDPMNR